MVCISICLLRHLVLRSSSSNSIPVKQDRNREIQCFTSSLVNRGVRIHLIILESLFTASFHFGLSMPSSFFSPISFTCLTTCLFRVIFDHPCFLLATTSKSNVLRNTSSLSRLKTYPYHRTPFGRVKIYVKFMIKLL